MDELTNRRRMMTAEGLIDTSPKIAEYGKYLGRSLTSFPEDSEWCYTEFYELEPQVHGKLWIDNNSTNSNHTYQYYGINTTSGTEYKDWFYAPRREIGSSSATINRMRFSLKIAEIDNVYALCETNGQIFFAGKNTPYYGYRNLADMPEGSAS